MVLGAPTMYIKARTVAAKGITLSPGVHMSHVCMPLSSNPGLGKAYLQCTAAISQELGGPRKATIPGTKSI